MNLALPPGTADAGWLRAFHAVVPSLLGSFRPQILVTQCGADTHAEDPLAHLRLSVDGHRMIYRELRELAEHTAGGKWLALGGGGYGLFRVVPRSWTHLLATVLDRDVDPHRPVPAGWVAYASRAHRPAAAHGDVGRRRRGARAVDRGRRPGGRRGARHPAGGLPAARPGSPRPARLIADDSRSSRPGPQREEHDAWTRRSRWPRPPHRSRTTRGTGRPTSSPRTAGSSTCARCCPATPTRSWPSTPGSPSAPATCATSARTRTSPRATWSGSPSSTTTRASRWWRWLGDEIIAVGRYEGRLGPDGTEVDGPGRGRVRRPRRPPEPRPRLDPARAPRRGGPRARDAPLRGRGAGRERPDGAGVPRRRLPGQPRVRRGRAAPGVRHRPDRALDGGPRRPRAARRGPQRAQRAAPALGRGHRRLHRPERRSATRCCCTCCAATSPAPSTRSTRRPARCAGVRAYPRGHRHPGRRRPRRGRRPGGGDRRGHGLLPRQGRARRSSCSAPGSPTPGRTA